MLFYFIKAWMIGLAIAAPVGPIGMLCINKTLELGLLGALLVGLGAATADSCYGIIAALGMSAISDFLINNAALFKIIGGIFLLYLAYKESKSTGAPTSVIAKSESKIKLAIEVFFLTVTNPMTILSFVGIFASISSGFVTASESITMVAGIFFGSMTWWVMLGAAVARIRHKLPSKWIERVKRFSSFILGGFGAIAVISGSTVL